MPRFVCGFGLGFDLLRGHFVTGFLVNDVFYGDAGLSPLGSTPSSLFSRMYWSISRQPS